MPGPNEKKEVDTLLASLSEVPRIYEFTEAPIEKIVALVHFCDLFIGNDTGPLRFADALQKKIIAFFGPVDDTVYGTFPLNSKRHRLLKKELPCRPCYRKFRLPDCPHDLKCLQEIQPEAVTQEVFDLWEEVSV